MWHLSTFAGQEEKSIALFVFSDLQTKHDDANVALHCCSQRKDLLKTN